MNQRYHRIITRKSFPMRMKEKAPVELKIQPVQRKKVFTLGQ
jgi:hypothetical protein